MISPEILVCHEKWKHVMLSCEQPKLIPHTYNILRYTCISACILYGYIYTSHTPCNCHPVSSVFVLCCPMHELSFLPFVSRLATIPHVLYPPHCITHQPTAIKACMCRLVAIIILLFFYPSLIIILQHL